MNECESFVEKVVRRSRYRLRRITLATIAQQQSVANFYFEQKVIPRKIDIRQAILPTLQYQAITLRILSNAKQVETGLFSY
ncbi:MAG: hypothetical protein V7K40_32140 [Nostoc sp.]|uniref:hypothetical protein n=1 Tax=Nostoc sp. TaxID=1180 RepID=UPI002FF85685